jgi:hypothetical protein
MPPSVALKSITEAFHDGNKGALQSRPNPAVFALMLHK